MSLHFNHAEKHREKLHRLIPERAERHCLLFLWFISEAWNS